MTTSAEHNDQTWNLHRRAKTIGAVSVLPAIVLAVAVLLLTMVPASGVVEAAHTVHYGAYYESTTRNKAVSLNGVSKLLVLSTPALPAGNYVATASVFAYTAEVLESNNTADITDYVDCYLAKLPNRTSTWDGNRTIGYGGYFTLSVTDSFAKLPKGTKLGLYCFGEEKTQGAKVDWASLEVTPYATLYTRKNS